MPVVERRTTDRTHNEQWLQAMRDELRKVQFLHAVEVDEVDGGALARHLRELRGTPHPFHLARRECVYAKLVLGQQRR